MWRGISAPGEKKNNALKKKTKSSTAARRKNALRPPVKPPRIPESAGENKAKFHVLFKSMIQGVLYRAADGTYIDINVGA